MELPHALVQDIRDGNVVLVLGAGASLEAADSNGRRPPSGWELAKLIASEYLGDGYDDHPLNEIAELAISEASLPVVQDFIVKQLEGIPPSDAHRTLTTFRWRGLATTNYDDLVEQAYKSAESPAQTLVPFRENGERVDEKMRQPNAVAYLKLHGCMSQPHREDLPFILTTDQYIEYRRNRSRLFDMLKEWASERTLLFVGYTLKDSTLRTLLLEISSTVESRARFYIVLPSFTEPEKRYWESRRITTLEGKASDLCSSIDSAITDTFRGARPSTPAGKLAISERFVQSEPLSANCQAFIESEVDYVRGLNSLESIDPRDFYKGVCPPWPAIEKELDVRRRLTDTMLADCFLDDNLPAITLSLVKGHAGSGKSIFLHRLAWDAAKIHDCTCLFLNETGILNSAALAELSKACGERIFLFVDDVLARATEMHRAIAGLSDTTAQVSVIGAVRTNEWNSYDGPLLDDVTNEATLHYLSEQEIDSLLTLLEKNNALHELETKSYEERKAAFVKRAGRQLLVALYEATHGKRFEEIICNEFSSITPRGAQDIYRSICVLYRFGAPVRAGVISRIHGVPFERFQERFLGPLENVVRSIIDPNTRDVTYVARHRQIAEIVFQEAIEDVQERFDEYMKCLQHLNIDYASDRNAFNQMVRGRSLLDMFSDSSMVSAIYDCATEKAPDNPLLLHQKAIWELNRPGGNLNAAADLLREASQLAPRNKPIIHTTAELALRRARSATLPGTATRHLDEAEGICRTLVNQTQDSHARHTLVKIGILRLEIALKQEDAEDAQLTKMLTAVEKELSKHLLAVPGDPFLLAAEADLAKLLTETSRAKSSLAKAFENNPRSTYVALSLARCHNKDGDYPSARAVLEKALEANPNDQRLHNLLTNILWESDHSTDEEIKYHAKRAYTPGDRNYAAQLVYARQVYLTETPSDARPYFEVLRKARVSYQAKNAIQYPLTDERHGEVVSVEANYCFVRDDENSDRVFAHEDNFLEGQWAQVVHGSSVSYRLGFTMRGSSAYDVQVL